MSEAARNERQAPPFRIMLPEEVAEELGISVPDVHRLFAEREIAGQQFGRSLRISSTSVEAYRERLALGIKREAPEPAPLILERRPTPDLTDPVPADAPPWLPPAVEPPAHDRGIYFLHGAGMVKIGYTAHPANRLSLLRLCSPVRLHLVVWFPAHPMMELILHEELEAWRAHGEWFAASGAVRRVAQYIATDEEMRYLGRRTRQDKGPEDFTVFRHVIRRLAGPQQTGR